MNIKCIAIGNRIMKDDSIGIWIVEAIKERIIKEGISVVICETDIDYALKELNNVDLLFIIDSSYYNIDPGTITVSSIENQPVHMDEIYSQHQPNLIDLIIKYNINVKCFIIAIEIAEISYSLELSECLKEHFNQLCEEVYKIIISKVKEVKYA